MRLLILGGTGFLGRTVAVRALRRGWTVTVFNRGLSGAPPSGAAVVRGDRLVPSDLTALTESTWDGVVDTWTGAPRAVRDSVQALSGHVGHYVYVSSCSVYRPPLVSGLTEDAPVVEGSPDAEDGPYPVLKAGAELAVRAVLSGRFLVARAGLILGPGEEVGRLPWWLERLARGGPVLAPGPAELPLQFIDVRDLADWLLTHSQRRTWGTFNVVSQPGHTTMGALLGACRAVTGTNAELVWVDPDVVLATGIEPWTELPIWIPPAHPARAFHEIDIRRAHQLGLSYRPATDTVTDTWAWLRTHPVAQMPRHAHASLGLDPEIEAVLLASLSSG